MLRIGLTGGIGSGKSTVAALFANHGVPVIDTDAIAHELSDPGRASYDEIIRTFGNAILDENRRLNRNLLRQRVFNHPEERKQLEAILHPRIREAVEKQVAELDADYCLIVIPLLIEARFIDMVDRILVVDIDEALQIKRTVARGKMPEDDIRKIIACQISREERLKWADDLIINNTGMSDLESEVNRLHQLYISLSINRN